jgi:hypothetical protein
MKALTIQLKDYNGLSSMAKYEISTEYLKTLVSKNID